MTPALTQQHQWRPTASQAKSLINNYFDYFFDLEGGHEDQRPDYLHCARLLPKRKALSIGVVLPQLAEVFRDLVENHHAHDPLPFLRGGGCDLLLVAFPDYLYVFKWHEIDEKGDVGGVFQELENIKLRRKLRALIS